MCEGLLCLPGEQVTRRQLLETQELEMLEAAGVVGNAEMFRKREVRQHTNTTYKQIRCA